LTLDPWYKSLNLAWDATIVISFAQCHHKIALLSQAPQQQKRSLQKAKKTMTSLIITAFNRGCGTGSQAILDGWSRSQKLLDGGAEA